MNFKIFLFFVISFFLVFSCAVEEDDPFNGESNDDPVSVNDDENVEQDDAADETTDETTDEEVVDVPDDDTGEQPDEIPQGEKLDDVTGFYADATAESITLNWSNPEMEGFQYVVLVKRMDRYAENREDGEIIYQGGEEGHFIDDVEIGDTYFFTIFACYGSRGCSKGVNAYAEPCYTQLDVVFSMDVSTTMGFILQDLENEIGLVWDFIQGTFSEKPRMGLTVFVDDVTVTNEGEPFDSRDLLKAEFNKWYQHTSTNKQTQSNLNNGDWPENSLDSIAFSARDFNWRDAGKTLRVIIHATDDTFYEHPDKFSNGIQVEYTYDGTIDLLVQENIRVAAFAAKLGGRLGNIDVKPGFFTDYNGKPSIPEATGGEVYFIEDVKNGHLNVYQAVNDFIENAMCKSYGQK